MLKPTNQNLFIYLFIYQGKSIVIRKLFLNFMQIMMFCVQTIILVNNTSLVNCEK
jgi:hypothetical protein